MKTFAWDAHPSAEDDLVGLGLTNGRVMLMRVASNRSESLGELAPRLSRPCNVVQFSFGGTHLVAAGLEKVRNDSCLLVWDIGIPISCPCFS